MYVRQAFFVTPAAEKTKTQAQISSQKLNSEANFKRTPEKLNSEFVKRGDSFFAFCLFYTKVLVKNKFYE